MFIQKETIFVSSKHNDFGISSMISLASKQTTAGAKRGIVWIAIMCWMFIGSLAMGQQTNELEIDYFQYATPAAAQAVWYNVWTTGVSSAGQAVLPATVDGESCLTLPYSFTTETVRGCWDRVFSPSLDLSSYTHLKFRINVASATGLDRIQLSFQAVGGTWWDHTIYLTGSSWQDIIVPLALIKSSGATSWTAINRMRVSAWKGNVGSGSITITDMRVIGDMVIDSFEYATSTAAQAEWYRVYLTGSSSAAQLPLATTIENVNCMTMPYVFTTETVRGCLDRRFSSLNLSEYSHLRFRVNGKEAIEGFGNISISFQTGTGDWWNCYVTDRNYDQFQTFVVSLADFTPDGNPTWDDIRRIRISAWKAHPFESVTGTGTLAFSDLRAQLSTSVNMLKNGGFEITNNGDLPDAWGSGDWGLNYAPWVLDTDDWRLHWGVDRTVSHSGVNSLRIWSEGDTTQIGALSTWVELENNKSYTLSAWLKSDQSALSVNLGIFSSACNPSQWVTVNDTWQKFTVSGITTSADPYARMSIYQSGSGTLWIDDVQLEENLSAGVFQISPKDQTINTQTVHRTPASTSDYPYVPGGSSVIVTIDSNRVFKVDGQPFIPISAGWTASENNPSLSVLQEIAKSGFNSICLFVDSTISNSDLLAILDDAKICGLKVIFSFKRGVTISGLQDRIANLKQHPTIIVWYVYDEPRSTAEWTTAQAMYNAAKLADSDRPAYVNFAYDYLPTNWTGDIVSADVYPVPVDSPMSVGRLTDKIEQLASPTKPVWMWQQAAGYAYSRDREPTGPEAECMAYSAMIYGARGFNYFWNKAHSAELWAQQRVLNQEIRTLTPLLSSTDTSPTVTTNSSSIHLLSKTYNGDNYIIAANDSPVSVTATLTISGASQCEVLFENRWVQVSNGVISDTFDGYQRHVYKY